LGLYGGTPSRGTCLRTCLQRTPVAGSAAEPGQIVAASAPRPDFFASRQCNSRAHCRACRLSPAFRQSLTARFALPGVDFGCPHGITAETLPTFPSVAEQVHNLSSALTRAASHVIQAHTLPVADSPEQERRWDICRGCANFVADTQRCRICGCRLKAKIKLDTDHCPDAKW